MAVDKQVRVRFAPSPTGDPHIGSIWTALFNWLFARHHGGVFVLRVEDTDQRRLVPGSMENIFRALERYDLQPDEGPQQGGPYGPYIQSQRLALYREHVERLIERGQAYYCFCTPERLEELRASQTASKRPPKYDKRCATLNPDEVELRRRAGEPATVRMKLPEHGTVQVDDIIRGRVSFDYGTLDDSVILKTDGFPTYHLANVIDDHLMRISHVIRAEEWLPSVPKHLWLYEAFGWTPPAFAHLPLLLGQDRSKLSKRHGATAALAFLEAGYLPAAMTNFLALMGWHPKTEQEIFSRAELIAAFSLECVNPAGAIFDQVKLGWMNGSYIRSLPLPQLLEYVRPFWQIPAVTPDEQLIEYLRLVQERLVRLKDINEAANFLFAAIWDQQLTTFDRQLIIPKKGKPEEALAMIRLAMDWLERYQGKWIAPELKSAMLKHISDQGLKNGPVLWPLRVALSLRTASPDVFDLLAVLGPVESRRRLMAFGR